MADMGGTAETRARLQVDLLRTLVASIIALLSIGGWIYVLSKPELLRTIAQQPPTWWVEQTVVFLQALLCFAIIARIAEARLPALILTGLALLITAGAWIKGMQLSGRHPIPFTPILHTVLLWRLLRSLPRHSERLNVSSDG